MSSLTSFYQISQVSPNSYWNAPELLWDGVGGVQVCVTTHNDDRMEVFFIAEDYTLYHVWQFQAGPAQGSFGGKDTFMGLQIKQMAAGKNADGTIHCFYIAMNDNIGHFWESSPNGAWMFENFGGQAKQIALCSNADGRLELFYVGMNDYVYHNWQDAPNSANWDWEMFDFQAYKIAVALGPDNRIQMVATSVGNEFVATCGLFSFIQSAPGSNVWSTWTWLGDYAKDLNFITRVDDTLELFFIALDDSIRYIPQDAPNDTWQEVQTFGDLAQQLCFAQDADGRFELFFIGWDGYCQHYWQTQVGVWPGSGGNAGFQASYLSGTTDSSGQIVVFFLGYAQPPSDPVAGFLGGPGNVILYNNGRPLNSPSVSLYIDTDLVISSDGPPGQGPQTYGLSLQLNAYSPLDSTIVWQQYVLEFDESNFYGFMNNWSQAAVTTQPFSATMAAQTSSAGSLSGLTIPAGYQFSISLNTTADGTVLGATFFVNPPGNLIGLEQYLDISQASGYSAGDLAPVVALTAVLVGPYNSETVTFSSGAASLVYSAGTALWPSDVVPPSAAYTSPLTGESANTVYQDITVNPALNITQAVSIQTGMTPKIQPRRGVPLSRLADWQAMQKRKG